MLTRIENGYTMPGNRWTTMMETMDIPGGEAGNLRLEHDFHGQDYLELRLEQDQKETRWLNVPVSRSRLKSFLRGHIALMSIIGNADFCFVSHHRNSNGNPSASTLVILQDQPGPGDAFRESLPGRERCERIQQHIREINGLEDLIQAWDAVTLAADRSASNEQETENRLNKTEE